ncbi:MAG TPA: hypothetical protein VH277_19315 [Gemmatimonadaceae bacterium]|nr:hypothetical protein [Gemmatimonadaceae bacterium]
MLLLIPLAALLLQAAPSQQAHTVSSDSAKSSSGADMVLEAANQAVLRFITVWRTAWEDGADRGDRSRSEIRLRDVHCHWDGSFGASPHRGNAQPPTLIHHGSRRSMCPNWIPTDETDPDDESFDRDVSLTPARRDAVRAARARLLDSLAILDVRKPGDTWITGQRVRFLVDQSDYDAAIEITRKCTAARPWCAELAGFVYHAARKYATADSAFDAAAAAMSPDDRCDWTDVRLLIDDDSRGDYERLSCDERVAANERLWWLSTPLFSDSVDDRRSAHFSRKVLVQLHSALSWDERYDWRGRFGGESVGEMLVRYGWPAYSNWAGLEEERSHAGWMNFYDSTRTATAEYPRNRLHLIPDFRIVSDPYHARSDAWQVNMPPLVGDDEPADQWWPAEHYARALGPIVQMTEQTAVFRRDHDVLLATAARLPSGEHHVTLDSSSIVLVSSGAAHHAELLEHRSYVNSQAIVLTARVPAKAAVIGAELRAKQRGATSARTRLGIDPPQPLETLHEGQTAISDPILLAADSDAPSSPESAMRQMLGTTHVRGSKLGLYWETYGFAPGDSVDVAVVLSRHEPLSKMRRIGMMLRVAHDINGSVAVRWHEPDLGTNGWTIPGILPIRARSIRVDMSRIEPGHYTVQVLVNRRGLLVPIASSREFVFDGAS